MTSDWIEAPVPAAAAALARPDWPGWLAPFLGRRGVGGPEEAAAFLEPDPSQLHDPFLIAGMEEAVRRLERAADGGEPVAVIGDYDVDGVSATALLAAVFRALGLRVQARLPRRLEEGYGFQPQHAEEAKESGCRLIVTADCGSTSHAAVAAALAAGLDVIVTDHHLPDRELPAAAVHLNPKRPACDYPFTELCGAGLAFKLASALAARRGRPIRTPRLLRIACLGTICDVVPLVGENRVIAAVGLAELGRTRSAGLRALMGEAGLRPPLSAADIAFRLGPRLNAAGRMDRADPALELLLTRDRGRAAELAAALEQQNRERQSAEARAVEEACERIERRGELPAILTEWSPDWHRGVVGIAASRVARRFHRPAILLSVDGERAHGSGRSIPGIHLHGFLSSWRDELERFGGHAQAVGLTAATAALEDLAARWRRAAADWDPALLRRRYEYDAALPAAAVGEEALRLVERLEPFGAGNRRPLFRIGPLSAVRPPRLFGDGHLAARCRADDGAELDLVGWGWRDRWEGLGERFEMLGDLERDRFTGGPVLRLVDARPAGDG